MSRTGWTVGLAGVGAGAVATACVVAAQVATSPGDPRLQSALRVAAQIEAQIGPADRNCGIFLLELNRPVESTDDFWQGAATRGQMIDAVRCVIDAKRKGQSAFTLWQRAGIDSTAFGGAAATAVSDILLVEVDAGKPDGVRLAPCLRPRVLKNGAIECRNTVAPLSSGDLDRVLSRLRRDVAQTAGEAQAAKVDEASGRLRESAATGGAVAPDRVANAVADVQRAVQAEPGRAGWPACPRHHDHPLEERDHHWYCARDRVFVAEVGGLARAGVPRVGK